MNDSHDAERRHRVNVRGMLTCGNTGQVRPSHQIEDGDCPACGRSLRTGPVRSWDGGGQKTAAEENKDRRRREMGGE